jgi:IS605 OrfB family transposase
MFPNSEQKIILLRWMDAYLIMYNKTIELIKISYRDKKKIPLDYKNLRTKFLKEDRNKIIENSQLTGFDFNMRVMTHILDGAIRLAVANYKSAITNFKNGHIRHFRIRYWRHNKLNKILDIDLQYFRGAMICPSVFKKPIYCELDNKEFDLNKIQNEYKAECKIQYNKLENKFYLFVPEYVKTTINKNKKIISLDPGIRTFMTGLSEKEVIKLGTNVSDKIKSKLRQTNTIEKNDNIPNKIKKKYEKRNNKKITNLVTEMHWKTIKYLIDNYSSILIGNMSVKGIVCNKTSKLTKMTKVIAQRMSFYTFRQRLEYKCESNRIHYKVVDERYTSKVCSNCGYIKKDLGGNKIYDCKSCKKIMDRDIQGCRGILIKTLEA